MREGETRLIGIREALIGRPGLACDWERAGARMTLAWVKRKLFDGGRHFAKVKAYAVNGTRRDAHTWLNKSRPRIMSVNPLST